MCRDCVSLGWPGRRFVRPRKAISGSYSEDRTIVVTGGEVAQLPLADGISTPFIFYLSERKTWTRSMLHCMLSVRVEKCPEVVAHPSLPKRRWLHWNSAFFLSLKNSCAELESDLKQADTS